MLGEVEREPAGEDTGARIASETACVPVWASCGAPAFFGVVNIDRRVGGARRRAERAFAPETAVATAE
ncbi:hypothetical protein [Streptomyces sp. NPDC058441]|uniref:hypothetical protein n=1 Tax=Streptomyces sp. NPDC058441 TaxID=3346502 RepID=UPI00364C5B67